jgi:hypothetical protein
MEKMRLIKGIINSIKENLEEKKDGSYSFKNNHKSMTIHTRNIGKELHFNPIEELCSLFEEEIVSLVSDAILIITGTLSVKVILSDTAEIMKDYYSMIKQVEYYDAIKTLFFPTMKEFLVKIGHSKPEWLHFPSNIEVKIRKNKGNFYIVIIKGNSEIGRTIEGTAIDFLKKDLDDYLENFTFRNPYPKETVILPKGDLTRETLKTKFPDRKAFYISDYYTTRQKIKYVKRMLDNFFKLYTRFIHDNFFFIRDKFQIFSKLPLKMGVYIKKLNNPFLNHSEDLIIECFFEKLEKANESCIEFYIDKNEVFDRNKHLFMYGTKFTNYAISYKNPLPFLYSIIRSELQIIIREIENYRIYEDLKPFKAPIESWIQTILRTEKKGGETINIELKRIPTESKNKDGKGNDLYGTINAMENSEGGYIFIGVDESKEGLDKIIGLEPYFCYSDKNLDMIKREIIDKCYKYLHKRDYLIEADQYRGKTLIRIRVKSNNGRISEFYPEQGDPCMFIRLNGKKEQMTPTEIRKRVLSYEK